MGDLRDHQPVVIEEFNGLWVNGDTDAVPIDHFSDCENIIFLENGFRTRQGIDPFAAIHNVVRMFIYVMQEGQTLLLLNNVGEIYHRVSDVLVYGPILSIPEMTDFKVESIAGRAYITPFYTETADDETKYQRGLEDEFVYVYLGDGTDARKAAGDAPTGTLTVANSGSAGNVEAGVHIFSVAYETDTGFITKLAGFADVDAPGGEEVDISNIPVSPDSFVVARWIFATKFIDPTLFTGDLEAYEPFFLERIDNNTDTTLTVSFFDSELIKSADYLFDLLEEIPAGAMLTQYHGRLVVGATFDDISLAYVSVAGEPEAIDAVDGIVIIPLDGNPITTAQEFRDVLYIFKKTRTYPVADNGDIPSSWPVVVLDQGIGASVHGIASVLDSGGVNLDFLLIVDYSGLMLFDGGYTRQEPSWKIRDLWFEFDRNQFNKIQVMNDSLSQIIYVLKPDGQLLFANYSNGLNAKAIRWSKWRFDVAMTTIALWNTNNLLLASDEVAIVPA